MSPNDDIVPLAESLVLRPRETAFSFASRLAAYCGCQSTDQFCQDFSMSLAKLMIGDEATIQRLAIIGNADFASLKRWSVQALSKKRKLINYEVIDVMSSARHTWSFCHRCAEEDIAAHPELTADLAVYGRAEWQTSFIRTCATHEIRLLSYSLRSKQEQRDLGNFLGGFFAELGAVSQPSHKVGPMERYVHARLTSSPHAPVALLDRLELWQVVSLSRALGAAIKGELAPFEQLSLLELEHCETLGFTALEGGYTALVAACVKMRAEHWADNARNGCLQRVGRALRKFDRSDAVQFVAGTIAKAAFATFPFKEGQELFGIVCGRTALQLSHGARLMLGISKPVWNALIANNPSWVIFGNTDPFHTIVDVDQAKAYFADLLPFISLRGLSEHFGVDPRSMSAIIAAGKIKPAVIDATLEYNPVYSLPAAERMWREGGYAQQGSASNDNMVPSGFDTLSSVSRKHGIGVSLIQDLVGSGGIRCIRKGTHKNINSVIWVDPMEVIERVFGVDQPMSIHQVSERIRLHHDSVRLLAADGILPSHSRPMRGGINYLFSRGAVEEFHQRYITARELAERGLKGRATNGAIRVSCPGWRRSSIRLFLRAEFDIAA